MFVIPLIKLRLVDSAAARRCLPYSRSIVERTSRLPDDERTTGTWVFVGEPDERCASYAHMFATVADSSTRSRVVLRVFRRGQEAALEAMLSVLKLCEKAWSAKRGICPSASSEEHPAFLDLATFETSMISSICSRQIAADRRRNS